MEASHALFGIDEEENFVGISEGMWLIKCSHHFIDRGSVIFFFLRFIY